MASQKTSTFNEGSFENKQQVNSLLDNSGDLFALVHMFVTV